MQLAFSASLFARAASTPWYTAYRAKELESTRFGPRIRQRHHRYANLPNSEDQTTAKCWHRETILWKWRGWPLQWPKRYERQVA